MAVTQNEDDTDLWNRFLKTRTTDLRNELVVANLHLVNIVVNNMSPARVTLRKPLHIDLDDMFSEGAIGLMQAISRYDPSLGRKFSTYACHRIRGQIIDAIRKGSFLPRHFFPTLEQFRYLRTNQPTLSSEDARKILGVSPEFMRLLIRYHDEPIIAPIEHEGLHSRIIGVEAMCERKEFWGHIWHLLEPLSNRDRYIFKLRYIDDHLIRKIAGIVGIDQKHIKVAIRRAIRLLQRQLREKSQ